MTRSCIAMWNGFLNAFSDYRRSHDIQPGATTDHHSGLIFDFFIF